MNHNINAINLIFNLFFIRRKRSEPSRSCCAKHDAIRQKRCQEWTERIQKQLKEKEEEYNEVLDQVIDLRKLVKELEEGTEKVPCF